jgi:hypothetical protein
MNFSELEISVSERCQSQMKKNAEKEAWKLDYLTAEEIELLKILKNKEIV